MTKATYSIHQQAVEIYVNGSWGKICDDGSWDDKESKVLCRSLGYDSEGAVYTGIGVNTNTANQTQKWFGSVSCGGNEHSLQECLEKRNAICASRKYVAVKCKPGT